MRNKLLVFLSVLIFGISPVFVYAEEPATTNTLMSDTTTTITPTSSESNSRPLKVRPTLHQELKDAKSEMRTKIMEARASFKAKIGEIKDHDKQAIVTNLDLRINTVNKNRTDEMYKRINRLSLILTKISSKEAALKSEGRNTTTLKNDIAAAQTAIDSAKQAVIDQAAKDYIMTIATDTTLKANASIVIKQFMADIKAVYLKVVAAQTAVLKAHSDVATLIGVKPTLTVTTVPTVATTP